MCGCLKGKHTVHLRKVSGKNIKHDNSLPSASDMFNGPMYVSRVTPTVFARTESVGWPCKGRRKPLKVQLPNQVTQLDDTCVFQQ
jgi:hypothetical protein